MDTHESDKKGASELLELSLPQARTFTNPKSAQTKGLMLGKDYHLLVVVQQIPIAVISQVGSESLSKKTSHY